MSLTPTVEMVSGGPVPIFTALLADHGPGLRAAARAAAEAAEEAIKALGTWA